MPGKERRAGRTAATRRPLGGSAPAVPVADLGRGLVEAFLTNERVNQVSDYVKEGQVVRVKVIEADDKGRLRLSMKAAAADDAAVQTAS